jgi:hypothetical protein
VAIPPFARAIVTDLPSINTFTDNWSGEVFTNRILALELLLLLEPHPTENSATKHIANANKTKWESFDTRGMLTPEADFGTGIWRDA